MAMHQLVVVLLCVAVTQVTKVVHVLLAVHVPWYAVQYKSVSVVCH